MMVWLNALTLDENDVNECCKFKQLEEDTYFLSFVPREISFVIFVLLSCASGPF